MSDEKKPRFKYLTGLGRVGVFYFIGLSIFFISAFLVITLRVSERTNVKVPELIGHLYLDEHNRLSDLGFRVELERQFTVNYPFGYILAQSLSAGKLVREGAKLVLLVNQSETIVKTPKLVGVNIELADKILQSIHIGNRTFALRVGVKTFIANDRPKGEILNQFPPSATSVVPGRAISLLISDGPKKLKKHATRKKKKGKKRKKKKTAFALPKVEGLNIEIVKKIAYYAKIPLQINAKETANYLMDGIILSKKNIISKNKNGASIWLLEVAFYKDKEENLELPNRFRWLKSSSFTNTSKIITLANSSTKNNVKYSEASLLSLNEKSLIPIYVGTKNEFAIWHGIVDGVLKQSTYSKETEENNNEDINEDSNTNESKLFPTKKTDKEKTVFPKPQKLLVLNSLEL